MFWDVLGLSMDTLTVCFKPACGAYAFFMRVLCFMCQTHLFAQMLSESTNTLQTFCLSSVHPHARLFQTQTWRTHNVQTQKSTQSLWTSDSTFSQSQTLCAHTYMHFVFKEQIRRELIIILLNPFVVFSCFSLPPTVIYYFVFCLCVMVTGDYLQ